MRLGIGSFTYAWAIGVPGHMPETPMTAMDLLNEAVRLDARVVQVCDNLPLVSLPEAELTAFEEAARRAGIDIEIGTRGLDTGNLLAYLRLAQRFGCPFVRLVIDRKGDEPSPEESVARLREVMPDFKHAKVRLALENHDRFSAHVFTRMIEELGPENAGICLDTVNSFGALEGPEAVVETLAPYTLNLHVKDFTIERVSSQMGFVISGCAVGRGRLDVPWLLRRLGALGRDVNAIVELWTPFGPALDETIARERSWAEESVRYLRQLIPN